MNALTKADVFAEDQLFATLDPTTRLVTLPDRQSINLPIRSASSRNFRIILISAFQATLEEVQEADVLLHVVDSSQKNYRLQMQAVECTDGSESQR